MFSNRKFWIRGHEGGESVPFPVFKSILSSLVKIRNISCLTNSFFCWKSILISLVKMKKKLVEEVFFYERPVGEIISFPVWIILFPVLKINFKLLAKNMKHLVKDFFWLEAWKWKSIPFPVWIISFSVLKINLKSLRKIWNIS